MTQTAPPIALTLGDPAGVGPAITGKAWAARSAFERPFYVIGDADCLARAGTPVEWISHPQKAADIFERAIPVLHDPCAETHAGRPNADAAPAIIRWIETAVAHARAGDAAAVCTNPINKALLYGAGFTFPGHTEFLADLCAGDDDAPRPVMMLVGGGLKVALATIHQPLIEAAKAIRSVDLQAIGVVVDDALRRDFGLNAPRLAFAGLNPHAGEDGALGSEEADIINPAAAALRAAGIDIADAQSGDTVFHHAVDGRYDAVIAMYHDQGLIPVKTLDFWGGVNVTLGLPIIRTSPDHGTGYDVAAAGEARAESLIAALKLAGEMARTRSIPA